MKSFDELLKLDSADAVASDEDVRQMYSWESGGGRVVQTAALVLAMRQVERTAVRLDDAGTRLQRWSIGLAAASFAVSFAALVIALLQ